MGDTRRTIMMLVDTREKKPWSMERPDYPVVVDSVPVAVECADYARCDRAVERKSVDDMLKCLRRKKWQHFLPNARRAVNLYRRGYSIVIEGKLRDLRILAGNLRCKSPSWADCRRKIAILKQAGADVVFCPDRNAAELYAVGLLADETGWKPYE